MVRFVTDRRRLAATPGLRFARQMGTGRGVAMGLGGDLRRWTLLAVWDDDAALDRFLAESPIAARWAEADETFTVRLEPLGAHGTWGGVDPFHDPVPSTASGQIQRESVERTGPVAVLTRATISPRHWWAFYRAVPPVEAALHASPGVLAVAGVGELPVGLQATFSLWRSADDLRAYAYAIGSPHAAVIARTRREGWFSEELFARFRPYASTGTWSGRDPLAEGNGS